MGKIEFRSFEGIDYRLYEPELRQAPAGRRFRLLVSQHGTRDWDYQSGGKEYMDIALQENDPDELGLFVVAPHVPAAETDPTPQIHGKNFSRYGGDYCHWLHRLVHEELPKVFEARGQAVETNRFYLYGQSKGGEFVQHYIMTFGGVDIFRAAAAAGRCGKNSDNTLEDMTWSQYYPVLDSLIKTLVVLIVGYKDSAACGEGEILIHPDDLLKAECVKVPEPGDNPAEVVLSPREKRWRRIQDVQKFICYEVRLRVHPEDFALLTVPPPRSDGPDGVGLWCDNYYSNWEQHIAALKDASPDLQAHTQWLNTPLPKGSMKMRFKWGLGGHSGSTNYKAAREFLFQDIWPPAQVRPRVTDPLTVVGSGLELPKTDEQLRFPPGQHGPPGPEPDPMPPGPGR